jgi:hypothetical protein
MLLAMAFQIASCLFQFTDEMGALHTCTRSTLVLISTRGRASSSSSIIKR